MTRQSPDVTELTRALEDHCHRNSRIYPGSRYNSRKNMRHAPRQEMRPVSAALHAEQFRVPHQANKEP